MLTIPVLIEGGAAQTVELRTPWMKAWARFRAGASPIDYIRPTGAGADGLLLTHAQTKRPNRDWWLNILDQYGASAEIGRASCRERVCQYVYLSVVAFSLKKKNNICQEKNQ